VEGTNVETALAIVAIIVGVLVFDAILESPRLLAALIAGGVAALLLHVYAPELLTQLLTAAGIAGGTALVIFVWLAPFILCTLIAAAIINVFSPNRGR
jgi:hypothetical protein